MYAIGIHAANALIERRKFTRKNTAVSSMNDYCLEQERLETKDAGFLCWRQNMYLYDHRIASLDRRIVNSMDVYTLKLSCCGYNTRTTKDRLACIIMQIGLLEHTRIIQKNRLLWLKWNGDLWALRTDDFIEYKCTYAGADLFDVEVFIIGTHETKYGRTKLKGSVRCGLNFYLRYDV